MRVYYEDTDAGGVVYYANYLRFLERSRTECLRSLGFEQDEIRANYGVLFAVRKLQVEYHLPARFNQELEVSAQISNCKHASILFKQSIKLKNTKELLLSAEVSVVCLQETSFKPCAIPKQIRGIIVDG